MSAILVDNALSEQSSRLLGLEEVIEKSDFQGPDRR